MTGKFTEKDPQRCAHYARFMQHLTLPQANGAFWILFIVVLALMTISGVQHHKSIQIMDEEKGMSAFEKSTRGHRRRVSHKRKRYLGIATLCFVLAIICVVMECFALFNIQYCDGEDLMQLYWGFWSVLQVGSLIAIGGVMVQFWIVLGNHSNPSWAVALGTPVLVFAALGWIFRSLWKRFWARVKGRKYQDSEDEEGGQESDDEKEAGSEYWVSRAQVFPTLYSGSGSNC
ncbi:hypothetical protein LSUE1_G000377, partial [Lachnellula suecica]